MLKTNGVSLDSCVGYWTLAESDLTVGEDLVTNGDFSYWVGNNPSNWTVLGESGTDPEISEVGSNEGHGGVGIGSCNLYSTSNGLQITQIILEIGKTYVTTFDITKSVSGAIKVTAGYDIDINLNSEESYRYIFTAVSKVFGFSKYGTADITIDNVVVKEIDSAFKDKSGNGNDGAIANTPATFVADQNGVRR